MRPFADRLLAPLGRGIRLTPRQGFLAVAAVLVLLLIALLVFLLYFLGRPESLSSVPPKQGIQPIWQVYGPGVGDKPLFDRPMGVAVGRGGRVYVTDSGNNRVCVFDSNGRFLFEFGGSGVAKPVPGGKYSYKPGRLNYPVGIDVDDDGNVYVASFYNDSIEVYDAEGKPLRRIPDPKKPVGRGSSGQDGGGIAVTDVAVSGDYVFATDQWQVFVFKRDGTFVRQWGKPGLAIGDLDHPNGLAIGEGGIVFVSDSNHARVTAFTQDGKALWSVGTPPRGLNDRSPRPLQLPRGLTTMRGGDVLVADSFAFQLVRISSKEQTVTARYGERGTEPGQLNFPNDVEALRGFFVVADKENGRVQCVRILGD